MLVNHKAHRAAYLRARRNVKTLARNSTARVSKRAAAQRGARLLTRAVLFQRVIVLCPSFVKRFRL